MSRKRIHIAKRNWVYCKAFAPSLSRVTTNPHKATCVTCKKSYQAYWSKMENIAQKIKQSIADAKKQVEEAQKEEKARAQQAREKREQEEKALESAVEKYLDYVLPILFGDAALKGLADPIPVYTISRGWIDWAPQNNLMDKKWFGIDEIVKTIVSRTPGLKLTSTWHPEDPGSAADGGYSIPAGYTYYVGIE